jgi:hypothetical protein
MGELDSRRYYLAGYLSALPEFSDRHPETLLPLADAIIAVLCELRPPSDPVSDEQVAAIAATFGPGRR